MHSDNPDKVKNNHSPAYNTRVLCPGLLGGMKRKFHSDTGVGKVAPVAFSHIKDHTMFQDVFRHQRFKLGAAPTVAESASANSLGESPTCLSKYYNIPLRQHWPLPTAEEAEAMLKWLGPDMALARRWLVLDPAREHPKYFVLYDLLRRIAKLQVSLSVS